MRIVLKHILKNIWEKKGRSLLIILSLIIATAVFVLNLTLPDEIILKMQETLRSMYGEAEIEIRTAEPFSIDDIKIQDEDYEYIGVLSTEISLEKEQAGIWGINIEDAKKIKMLGEDVPNLEENQIVISKKQAEKYSYKEGEKLIAKVDEKEYELEIVKIVEGKGLAGSNPEFPMFFSNVETLNKIMNIEEGKYDSIFFNVKNDSNVKNFVEYLKENNENFMVQSLVDVEAIKEELSFISYIMILIFALATIMIFFVVSSLNKIIIAERMPVIGTFRSVGATKTKMNWILILENVVYGLIGGLIGTIIGYALNSKAASLFITTDGVELTNKTTQMTPGAILIGIAFAIVLEIFISIRAIRKANKKPIKDIIFDVQSTRYRILKGRIILGTIMVVSSLVINYLNKKMEIVPTIISIILYIVGVANLVPLIMRMMSKLLAIIFKKIGWATGIIASKNIGYNKMIIASSRLIVVAIALILSIITVSGSITEIFNSFRYVMGDDCDIIMQNVTKTATEYEKLLEIDEITKIEYMYYAWDEETTYNNGIKFSTNPIMLGQKEKGKYIKELDYKVEDLKHDELLIDEKLAESNNIKVNDVLNMKFGSYNAELKFKVVGLINSAYFTTSRNVMVINLEKFKENLTDVPMQVQLATKEGTDLEKTIKEVEDTIKETAVKIETAEEFVDRQEEQTASMLSMFYVIIGLAISLSFIGIVNNQIISFIQRRKEFAVLTSTCMSKSQLKKMLIVETILANIISCSVAVVVGFITTRIIESFMQGLTLYVDIIFNWNIAFKFVGIIFLVLLFTVVIPIKRLSKMKIVEEIKYE